MATISLTDSFSVNVRREMDARGWSQLDLSEKSGIAQSYISGILKGNFASRFTTVEKIATAFGVHPSALLLPPLDEHS